MNQGAYDPENTGTTIIMTNPTQPAYGMAPQQTYGVPMQQQPYSMVPQNPYGMAPQNQYSMGQPIMGQPMMNQPMMMNNYQPGYQQPVQYGTPQQQQGPIIVQTL
jgi:hypothetical protein